MQARLTTAALAVALGMMGLTGTARAAIDIQFDYSYDGGFFTGANVGRQAVLEQAAAEIESRLQGESFASLVPSGRNSWSLSFDNPGNTGNQVVLDNLVLAADTVKIYVGASDLGSGASLGFANYGTSYSGTSGWLATIAARNTADNYEPLGGGITFNSAANWHFGLDTVGLQRTESDFYSVAQHEILHLLGFGQSKAFDADISSGQFVGSAVQAVAGGPVALSDDEGHWAQNTTYLGKVPVMVGALLNGQRNAITELDYAALRDIGYNVSSVPEPGSAMLGLLGLAALSWGVRRKRSG